MALALPPLLLALLVLFSGRRVQAGMNISPNNAAAQTAFQAQVAYDEAKTMEKLPPLSGKRRAEHRRLRGRRRGAGGVWRQPVVLTVLPWNAG